MSRTRARASFIVIAVLAASIALAACGNNDSTTSTAAPASAPATGGGAAAQVAVADNDSLGQILVDGDGRTLYLFEKDTAGDQSTCSGECAKAWPPLTTKGEPQAGGGVDASKLTTFSRDDGTTQVSYADHPLYYYAGDQAPGDTNGNDLDQFGAVWWALTPSGESAGAGADSSGDTTTSSDGGSGYSY